MIRTLLTIAAFFAFELAAFCALRSFRLDPLVSYPISGLLVIAWYALFLWNECRRADHVD